MGEYKFKYLDKKKSLFLFISFPIVWFLVFSIMDKLDIFINVYFAVLIPLGIAFLFVWLTRKRIESKCITRINTKSTEIEKLNELAIISFDEIISYKIQRNGNYQEVILNLNNSQAIKLCNYSSFFNKSEVFQEYCLDLEDAIDDYQVKYNFEIKREKLFFEKKWTLIFLILLSTVWILSMVWIIAGYKSFEFLLFIFPMLILWAGYFNTIKK